MERRRLTFTTLTSFTSSLMGNGDPSLKDDEEQLLETTEQHVFVTSGEHGGEHFPKEVAALESNVFEGIVCII